MAAKVSFEMVFSLQELKSYSYVFQMLVIQQVLVWSRHSPLNTMRCFIRMIGGLLLNTYNKQHPSGMFIFISSLPFCFVLFIFFHQPIKDATIIPTGGEEHIYTTGKTQRVFLCVHVCWQLESRYVLLIIANDGCWLMRGFLHARGRFIFGSHEKRE